MSLNKIKTLIIEDSNTFAEILRDGLSKFEDIDIIAISKDPLDAINVISKNKPDVILCDIHMPKMDGIAFVKIIVPIHRIPVIMVSSVTESIFDAINAGAVDFIPKPISSTDNRLQDFYNEVYNKIKATRNVKLENKKLHVSIGSIHNTEVQVSNDIIAIGASTGGTEAIYKILKACHSSVPGIVITQHIPPMFSRMFADRLNKTTPLNVKEAEDGDIIERGRVLIAPGGKHMEVKKVGNIYKAHVWVGEKVNGHCPSVDVLFESVAREVKGNALGIILTGMGADGAKGLLKMRQEGCHTIGQDEKSCVVYGMPKSAYDIGAVERQVSLGNIVQTMYRLLK